MTDKELLYRDLFARLPYGIFVEDNIVSTEPVIYTMDFHPNYFNCKPYLRPMSSMTEEEYENFRKTVKWFERFDKPTFEWTYESYDWLNAHHFDYRGLLERGLALEAPEDMYTKK